MLTNNDVKDEFKAIMENRFKESINTAPVAKKEQESFVPSTNYKLDFSKAAADFWYTKGVTKIKNYNTGKIIGNHTAAASSQSLDRFTDLFTDALLELIKSEGKRLNKPISTEILEILKNTLSLSFKQISSTNNLNDILAFLQGFLNSFIESNNES